MAVGALAGGVLLGGVGAVAGAALRSGATTSATFRIELDTGDVILARADTRKEFDKMLGLQAKVEARTRKREIEAVKAAAAPRAEAKPPTPKLDDSDPLRNFVIGIFVFLVSCAIISAF
ncbi:MAG: hypothetical protein ACE37J_12015 [Pikeienuella sp.]|uniref:hypothetical protein n=1 Tax=Pikeienuella sp. TaxID=2831957 RepID=UPI00391AEE48